MNWFCVFGYDMIRRVEVQSMEGDQLRKISNYPNLTKHRGRRSSHEDTVYSA